MTEVFLRREEGDVLLDERPGQGIVLESGLTLLAIVLRSVATSVSALGCLGEKAVLVTGA